MREHKQLRLNREKPYIGVVYSDSIYTHYHRYRNNKIPKIKHYIDLVYG